MMQYEKSSGKYAACFQGQCHESGIRQIQRKSNGLSLRKYLKKKCKAALKQWNSSTQDEVADFHIKPQNSIFTSNICCTSTHSKRWGITHKARNHAQSLIMIKKKQNAKRSRVKGKSALTLRQERIWCGQIKSIAIRMVLDSDSLGESYRLISYCDTIS